MEEVPVKTKSTTAKAATLLLKIAVTVICFWYISKKIDFTEALNALLKANWAFMLLAVLLLLLSKLIAAFRLNIYFKSINLNLPHWQNIRLYWLGMFYNLFLPGAISGDAYKVILLKKKYETPYKKTSSAVLLDRFSGLLGIAVILTIYGLIVLENNLYNAILISGSFVGIAAFYFVIKFYLPDFISAFWPTFFGGIIVQFVQVICVYCILNALHISLNQAELIFIFLVSSVVSVIPVSLGGGLGTREFVFVTGAAYFHLNAHTAVIVSLLFYISNVLSSVWGIYFVFNDPLRRKIKKEINVAT